MALSMPLRVMLSVSVATIVMITTLIIMAVAAISMLLTVARGIFIGVPAILHKIYTLAAGVIGGAVFRPFLGVARRYPQINRLLLDVTPRPLDDDRLRVDKTRLGKIANVNAAVKTWLADIDRYADVGRHGGRRQGKQACSNNECFHDVVLFE